MLNENISFNIYSLSHIYHLTLTVYHMIWRKFISRQFVPLFYDDFLDGDKVNLKENVCLYLA